MYIGTCSHVYTYPCAICITIIVHTSHYRMQGRQGSTITDTPQDAGKAGVHYHLHTAGCREGRGSLSLTHCRMQGRQR